MILSSNFPRMRQYSETTWQSLLSVINQIVDPDVVCLPYSTDPSDASTIISWPRVAGICSLMTNMHKRRSHADSGIIVRICDLERLEIPQTNPICDANTQLDPSLLRDGLFSCIRIPSSPPLILTLILPSRSSSCITIFTQVL